MMSSRQTMTSRRTTVRTPTGDEIEAWVVYRPDGDGPHPAVVMAHGFASGQEDRTDVER
jgi:fermentation-respiration switch protein FrsA (DUF1100 family)